MSPSNSDLYRIEVYGPGKSDWRAVLRTPLRSIETRDTSFYAPTRLTTERTDDGMLNVIPIGKVLSLGKIWAGDLKPILDAHVTTLGPLVTPFTIGNTLQPDSPIPGQRTIERQRPLRASPQPALSLGRVYGAGDGRAWAQTCDLVARSAVGMAQQMRDRSVRDDDPGDPIDLTGVMDSLRHLHSASRDGLPAAVHAALVGVKDAIAAVGRPRSATTDRSHVGPNDFGRVVSPAEINKANRTQRPVTLDFSPRGPVNATTRRINEANRAAREAKRAAAIAGWQPPDAA